MNNGVENTNNINNGQDMSVLKPMEGVRIAPVSEGAVNASNPSSATLAVSSIKNSTPISQEVQTSNSQTNSSINQGNSNTSLVSPSVVNETVSPNTVNGMGNTTVANSSIIDDSLTDNNTNKKKKKSITPILLIFILLLGGYIVFSTQTHKKEIEKLNYECTPITASDEVNLDLDSTIVNSLYSKVKTSILEDIAQPEFNDDMRIYLAFRQISDYDMYDSNCNLFSNTSMEPYTCEVSTNFAPRAFKEDVLTQKLKELYGEKTEIPLQNIRLGDHSCIGGFQYIKDRGEFVEGYCKEKVATSFKVDKTLVKATSTKNTIVLEEEVKYHENEKLSLPESLKSGTYFYTFRLDINYNYVLVSKTYQSKY